MNMVSKKIRLFIVTAVLFGFTNLVTAANVNLAVVDVTVIQQQFMTEVNDKLGDEFKKQQNDIQRELDQFKKDQDEFQKNSKTMSEKQLAKTTEDLVGRQNELQQKVQKFDQEVAVRRQEELQNKLKTLMDIVQKISDTNKYDMVLAKTAALYVSDKYDITTQVVDGYKDAAKKASKNK